MEPIPKPATETALRKRRNMRAAIQIALKSMGGHSNCGHTFCRTQESDLLSVTGFSVERGSYDHQSLRATFGRTRERSDLPVPSAQSVSREVTTSASTSRPTRRHETRGSRNLPVSSAQSVSREVTTSASTLGPTRTHETRSRSTVWGALNLSSQRSLK